MWRPKRRARHPRSANSRLTVLPGLLPLSGRSRQHIEAAVVVDLWLRQAQCAVPTLTGFGGPVEQVLGIEVAQPVQGGRGRAQ